MSPGSGLALANEGLSRRARDRAGLEGRGGIWSGELGDWGPVGINEVWRVTRAPGG